MQAGKQRSNRRIVQLLADEYSRQILLAADREPQTAKELSRRCDASLTTVYRRVSTLQEHDLVEGRSTVDGSHRRQFETAHEELHVELSDGDLDLSLGTRDELADNFRSLWAALRDST